MKLNKVQDQLNNTKTENYFSELMEAIKYMAIYDTKLAGCKAEVKIILPRLRQMEALSSMQIEGTQTTMTDFLNDEANEKNNNNDVKEVINHSRTIINTSSYIKDNGFSNEIIKQINFSMLDGVSKKNDNTLLGKYKNQDNYIVNSAKTIIFNPPSHLETQEYMDDLIDFMNKKDDLHPLIKSAVIHAQFESIHPFSDGNGRVGRLLIPLYFYYSGVINSPFFYMSEALQNEKVLYYKNLTASRSGKYDEWIKFFLSKCTEQAKSHIKYIDSINDLYASTFKKVNDIIPSKNAYDIVKLLFEKPILNSNNVSKRLDISQSQAKRYLKTLVDSNIMTNDDRQRNTTYLFVEYLRLLKYFK